MEKLELHDGGYLQYEWDTGGGGLPVVFLNGILMNLRSWNGQRPVLSEARPCLLHDFRGQLYSSKELPEAHRLEGHVSDTKALLDHLGIRRCHLVGTSYGGEVALLFAKAYPEQVQSLSVIASVSYSDGLLQRQVRLWDKLSRVDAGLLYDAVVSTSYSAAFLERHGNFLDMRRQDFEQLPAAFFTGFQKLCAAFLAFQLSDEALAQISAPALIIAAEHDILKPPHYSERMAEAMPHSEYVCLKGAGHAVVIEQPKTINPILRGFIEKNEP